MRVTRLRGLYVVSLVACGFAFNACGSEDGKKVAARYPGAGGDGGEPANDAGKPSSPAGGEPTAIGGAGGAGPSPSSGGEGGTAHTSCPTGFGDCDDDPSDCETPLDTVTACGACDVSCDGSHGDVTCSADSTCVVNSCAPGYDSCDDAAATGCEAKLDSDDHCGACTRDCTVVGATCTTGSCSVLPLSPHGQSYQSVVGGGAEFVMKVGAIPVSHYTLIRIPLDGSAEKTIWEGDGGVGLDVLYADATDLYWAVNGAPASVVKKAISAPSGDSPTVLFQPLHNPYFLTVHEKAFFWMTNGPYNTATLFTRPLTVAQASNGTEIMTVDQKNVTAFAITTDRVYWVARGAGTAHLSYVPLAGGAPTDVPGSVVADNAPLYAVGDTIYFARVGASNLLNGVYKYKAGDKAATQLTQAESINTLIVDETGAAYYRATFIDGTIYKTPPLGGKAVGIAKVPGFAGFAGQDAKLIYTYYDWGSAGPAYKIVK